MIIVCQQCAQQLPKTAVMCPNCGSRKFARDTVNSPASQPQQPPFGQPKAHDVTQPANTDSLTPSAWQSYTPHVSADNNTGNYQQANVAPVPVNRPMQQPVQPIYEQGVATQTPNQTVSPYPSQPTYQTPMVSDYHQATDYVAPPVQPYQPSPYPSAASQLPSTALQTRKPAYSMLYAGFVRRGFAYGFDLALVSVLLGLAHQLLLPQILPQIGIRGFNDQTLALMAYGFYLFYMTFLTCLGRQATVGKVIMGMWVFGMQGQRVNFFHALIRETLKLILLPFSFLMWFTARKQTLHDLIARTVVLYDPN